MVEYFQEQYGVARFKQFPRSVWSSTVQAVPPKQFPRRHLVFCVLAFETRWEAFVHSVLAMRDSGHSYRALLLQTTHPPSGNNVSNKLFGSYLSRIPLNKPICPSCLNSWLCQGLELGGCHIDSGYSLEDRHVDLFEKDNQQWHWFLSNLRKRRSWRLETLRCGGGLEMNS